MAQKKSTLPIVEPAESTIHDQPAPNKSVGGRKKRARRLKKTAKKQAESQKRKRAKTDLDGGSEDDVQLTAKKRNIGVCLNLEPLNLLCGWTDCKYSSTNYAEFTEHALDHANQIIKSKGSFQCQWNDCTYKTSDQLVFECHSSYHPYFEKLKCIGKNVRERLNLAVCNFNLVDAIPVFMAPFQCDWDSCNDYFTKVQMFFDHVMCHVNGVPKLDSNELLSCCWLGCRESFKSVHKLKEHTGSHIRIKVAACPQCNRTFASKTKFQDHCRRHDNDAGDQFQCSQCLKVLTTERLLREHVRLHVNHYKCHLCDMTCTTPATLSRHIRYRHLSERPFKCEYCQHGCVTKRDLRVHMRTHFADKLFECDECDFKCRSMFGLKGHFVKEHKPPDVDHRLYACHCCSKRFSRGSLLTSHLLKFHNFRWPSGHSRFRYKLDVDDGLYRLQTVRYESIEVTQEIIRGPPQQTLDTEIQFKIGREKMHSEDQSPAYVLITEESNETTTEQFSNNIVSTENNVVITIYDIDSKGNTLKSETVQGNELLYTGDK